MPNKQKKISPQKMPHKFLWANILLIFILLLSATPKVESQVFANINLSRDKVYVQEPFRVTITVYTKTWFTAPVEFGNLQIPNAFIIPFDDTQPGMFTIGGKQYPGIQFYYIVFPYKAGNFTVPAFEVTAQSPPEGSSTSRKIVIKTPPQSFEVKDVPEKLKAKGAWFVAKGVSIRENWSHDLQTLKVGDVLKRTITIDAKGTLPQFIPAVTDQTEVKWASTYPQDPILTDTRAGGDANGRSVQTITYLLEKAGNYTIPEINLSFWNPYSSKINTQSLKEEKIHVADNPDLGILTTLKDSLDATVSKTGKAEETHGPLRILGMPWYYFAAIVIGILLLVYILIRFSIKGYRILSARRKKYLASEAYKFRQFIHSGDNNKDFLNALYAWWDSLKYRPSASVSDSLIETNNAQDAYIVESFMDQSLNSQIVADKVKDVKRVMEKYRKENDDRDLDEDKGVNEEQKIKSI